MTDIITAFSKGDTLLFLDLKRPGLITLSINYHCASGPNQGFLWPEIDDKRILSFLKDRSDCREFMSVVADMFGYNIQEEMSDEEKILFVLI